MPSLPESIPSICPESPKRPAEPSTMRPPPSTSPPLPGGLPDTAQTNAVSRWHTSSDGGSSSGAIGTPKTTPGGAMLVRPHPSTRPTPPLTACSSARCSHGERIMERRRPLRSARNACKGDFRPLVYKVRVDDDHAQWRYEIAARALWGRPSPAFSSGVPSTSSATIASSRKSAAPSGRKRRR